jgi:hypothetical protein
LTTYWQERPAGSAPKFVSNSLKYKSSCTDNYSAGSALQSDQDIENIVSTNILAHKLPLDNQGIYVVMTSADVTLPGFCTSFCGWHTYGSISNTYVKYAFMGDSDGCPQPCYAQSSSPNGNPSADGIVSVLAHELAETVSDPYISAWFNSGTQENGDMCAWTWGAYYSVGNGAYANVKINGTNYLIQQLWLNQGNGGCALHYP